MPSPWTLVDSVATKEGALELRRRNDEWMISIAGRVLMSSAIHRSEDLVATLALSEIRDVANPRVIIGGLGLGFTLRAALDALPRTAEVTVAELNPRVVDWCRGPVAPAIRNALDDPRVRVEVGDVMAFIRRSKGIDAIVVDLYEGPRALPKGQIDPLYGSRALDAVADALSVGGVYSVWSEDPYPPFESRLRAAGFDVERKLAGRGGPRHAVYVARLRRRSRREGDATVAFRASGARKRR